MNSKILRLGLLLLLTGSVVAVATPDNLIANGNFTTGKMHWQGDGDVTPAGGTIFIRLKRDQWKILSQKITTAGSRLELKVTYSLSPFCTVGRSRSADDPVMPLTSAALKSATGLPNDIHDLPLGDTAGWLVFLLKDGKIVGEAPVTLPDEKTDPYIYTTTFSVGAQPLVGESICFAFPPGKGMVTIANVQLLRSR